MQTRPLAVRALTGAPAVVGSWVGERFLDTAFNNIGISAPVHFGGLAPVALFIAITLVAYLAYIFGPLLQKKSVGKIVKIQQVDMREVSEQNLKSSNEKSAQNRPQKISSIGKWERTALGTSFG